MKGARALGCAALVLAVICLVPAVSAAENDAPASETTTTTPPSEPASPPPPPAPAPDTGPPSAEQKPAKQEDEAAGEARSQERTVSEQTTGIEGSSTAGGAGTGRKARASATATVTMGDFFFSPATVSIAVGDLVTWRNTGKEPHNAVADDGSFDTGTVPAGQSASRMFPRAGTFSYICTIHPQMKGTVRVLSSGGANGAGGSAGSSSGSGLSEADAVNSPQAAGDANTLPMSGMAAGVLALVGLGLLTSGLLVRLWGRKVAAAAVGRQLRLF